MYKQGAPNMERVEKNAATVEEECNFLAAVAAVVKHEQDKLNQEREDKKKI